MERLTKRRDDGKAWYNHHPDKSVSNDELLDRLAAYEDTGLTPEQVKEMAEKQNFLAKKRRRPVVRVDVQTGEAVRFESVTEAARSVGNSNISFYLLTNKPFKGYQFYYEEEWKGNT